jgi:hypothetical protein
MTLTRRPALFAALTLIACWGCDILNPGQEYSGQLNFAIREGYYVDFPPPPHIALILETAKEYECMNYHLEAEFNAVGEVLRVAVSDKVRTPNICLTAIGPAQYRVALPVTTGSYVLEFTREGATDRYTVTVTDAAIEVVPIDFTTFTHPKAASFPRGN